MEKLRLIKYNEKIAESTTGLSLADCFKPLDPNQLYWFDFLKADQNDLDQISQHFELHHLIIEDITRNQELPNVEVFDNCLFVSTKLLTVVNQVFSYEHVCFVLGTNYLLLFQEVEGDVFDTLRNRILQNTGRVRKKRLDYLLIRMLAAIVKHYEVELEQLRETIEELELKLMENQAGNLPATLVPIRHKVAELRRYVRAQERAIDELLEDSLKHIASKNFVYLRDVQDNLIQLTSMFDVFRDTLASLMDLHLSNLSQNMNTVMKTLTVVSSVFIPLTFLAGIYGMNFKYMPELAWKGAYPTLITVMLIITTSMIIYLKRKKWI